MYSFDFSWIVGIIDVRNTLLFDGNVLQTRILWYIGNTASSERIN